MSCHTVSLLGGEIQNVTFGSKSDISSLFLFKRMKCLGVVVEQSQSLELVDDLIPLTF